jgi:hypothetical protein
MARKTKVVRNTNAKNRQTVSSLTKERNRLEGDIADEMMFQELNTEDHPISSEPSAAEKKASEKKEKNMRVRLKAINRMISKMSGKSGGAGGRMMMPQEYSKRTLYKPKTN